MARIAELKNAIDEITSSNFCAKRMDRVGDDLGNALETVIHHADRYVEAHNTITRKIEKLKESSDYPHNFKGQMVDDFEWVLSLLD